MLRAIFYTTYNMLPCPGIEPGPLVRQTAVLTIILFYIVSAIDRVFNLDTWRFIDFSK